ncbi:MAG: SMP-30/gluconolactonase/LRE family protein [Nitrospiraceae bacterium]|nr:SMP-30/gluconolactonase/LRE family protein [Nitrospiraceae bacterium]
MKKVFLCAAALALIAAGYFAPQASAIEKLNGTVYIAGHGGHLAIVDLATMRPPTDIEKDRIVITEAGSEMEGVIAGMNFEKVKKAGGTHGSALIGDKLYVGLLDGKVVEYDLATGKKSKPIQVGEKFCDAVIGPDGNIYFEDMADGNVYVFDPKGLKTVDKMPVGKAVCGIAWTRNDKKAYVSDMPLGVVYVIDWKTKKTIKTIKDPDMTFIHQIRMAPDQRHLWVAAANEFDPGLKPGTHHPYIVVIDTKTDTVSDHIQLPDDMRLHDVKFSPSGKTALITARTYKNDSVLALMDVKTHKIEKKVSVCYSCHSKYGIEVRIDNNSPLLCGMAIKWGK